MGIMASNDINNKSELNRRINADLRARVQDSSSTLNDPEYDRKNQREVQPTHRFGWVWIVLIVLALISLACIVLI